MTWRTLAVDAPGVLAAAASVLGNGGAIVLPTDTVYGLATLPGHEDVLSALKERPAAMPIAVLVAGVEQAEAAAGRSLPLGARRLAARFWPGPLTLVVPGAAGGTVGVRSPDHEFVLRLVARTGPIATTSANRHGAPTPVTAAEAAAALAAPGPSLVIDGGPCGAIASTVVDVSEATPRVLREGALPAADVMACATERQQS
jgi:tRNA threonylcarbamoyl adenosine modification protein (Sua5/YciO/YrdC/YwlC family)